MKECFLSSHQTKVDMLEYINFLVNNEEGYELVAAYYDSDKHEHVAVFIKEKK